MLIVSQNGVSMKWNNGVRRVAQTNLYQNVVSRLTSVLLFNENLKYAFQFTCSLFKVSYQSILDITLIDYCERPWSAIPIERIHFKKNCALHGGTTSQDYVT